MQQPDDPAALVYQTYMMLHASLKLALEGRNVENIMHLSECMNETEKLVKKYHLIVPPIPCKKM